ncbi:hypothetical protein C8Q80DRAFT_201566 [Daedaleopsis nitida]|nr:hypothetical protein C8Q80DRAFT_201566 [Daedaleopsis nitida]
MLHCDLSVGNVIVVPIVVLDEARGVRRIELRGMLIDWKYTRAITHLARRRVGDDIGFDNLGYLSVACLDDRLRIPRIPDELESLVYVLFKIAVITLRHGILRDGRLVVLDYEEHQLLHDLLLTFDRVLCADSVGWHRASGKPKRDFVTAGVVHVQFNGYDTTAGANRNGVGAFLGDAHPIEELFRVCHRGLRTGTLREPADPRRPRNGEEALQSRGSARSAFPCTGEGGRLCHREGCSL